MAQRMRRRRMGQEEFIEKAGTLYGQGGEGVVQRAEA